MDFGDDPVEQDFLMEDEPTDTSAWAHCPYCGEPSELLLDPGGGESQEYVEDCPVCCRPWTVRVEWLEGQARVDLQTEDESGF
ncbi:MAG TPA: CPXCG motif-containing cysteine-rich protein [Longimicrobiales bacterium]|nr:CPXCG motif-containing cysteine-rich protein [Longimicrobiales bacterium]